MSGERPSPSRDENFDTRGVEGRGLIQDVEAMDSADASQTDIGNIPSGTDEEAEGLWDHDKASTMAGVLQDEGTFTEAMDKRQAAKDDYNSSDYVGSRVTLEQADVDDAVDSLKAAILDRDVLQDSAKGDKIVEDAADELDRDFAALEQAQEAARQEAPAILERLKAKNDREIMNVLSPYEELYDTNPDKFATMPTAEFMELGKALIEAARDASEAEYGIERIQHYAGLIQGGINGKIMTDQPTLNALIFEAMSIGADRDALEGAIKIPDEDRFDKSPHEIMEGYLELLNGYKQKLEEKLTAARNKRQTLLTAHGSEGVQSSETSGIEGDDGDGTGTDGDEVVERG